jgi:ankyrin repeat protein
MIGCPVEPPLFEAISCEATPTAETRSRIHSPSTSLSNMVDCVGRSSLHLAAMNGNTSIVNLLLSNGANIDLADKDGNTPLHLAINCRHEDVTRILLYSRTNDPLDEFGKSSLHLAVERGDAEIVKLLLETTDLIDVKDSFGLTPLHAAVQLGFENIVRLILERGSQSDACDNHI